MRFLGGGIGHKIWHLLPQPPPASKKQGLEHLNVQHSSESQAPPNTGSSLKRKRQTGDNEESEEDLSQHEQEDFGYEDPIAVREDDEADWVDEVDEDGNWPEDEGNAEDNEDFDLRGFAEL